MTIELERVALLLDVAEKVAQWPKLNGIAGMASDELTEANNEALKILAEKAKEKAEKEAEEAAKAKEEAEEESQPVSASGRRI